MIHAVGLLAGLLGIAVMAAAVDDVLFRGGAVVACLWLLALAYSAVTKGGGGD